MGGEYKLTWVTVGPEAVLAGDEAVIRKGKPRAEGTPLGNDHYRSVWRSGTQSEGVQQDIMECCTMGWGHCGGWLPPCSGVAAPPSYAPQG